MKLYLLLHLLLHLLCSANRVPLCYELSPANVADVRLSEELIAEAGLGEAARRLFLDLPYSSAHLREALAEVGILVATEPSERRHAVSQHIERER